MGGLRNVAVVAFAQAPIVARDERRIATEILYPQVRRALAECGVERAAIDYQVAGSSDYIDGRPFGFVAALDVTGSWPAKQDLHLEMDAAFAAHYAWIACRRASATRRSSAATARTRRASPSVCSTWSSTRTTRPRSASRRRRRPRSRRAHTWPG